MQDPLHYWTITNEVYSPTQKSSGNSWHDNQEVLDVLLQIIIEMCSLPRHIIVDSSASTSASSRASQASRHHFFGFEPDREIFEALLKPLCSSKSESEEDDDKDPTASKDDWTA